MLIKFQCTNKTAIQTVNGKLKLNNHEKKPGTSFRNNVSSLPKQPINVSNSPTVLKTYIGAFSAGSFVRTPSIGLLNAAMQNTPGTISNCLIKRPIYRRRLSLNVFRRENQSNKQGKQRSLTHARAVRHTYLIGIYWC